MDATPTFTRHTNETEAAYRRRARKHIVKHAPIEQRYFTRNGKSGSKADRWFIPGMLIALGLFFAISGYLLGADIRNLNGPNGAQGEFVVEDLSKQYDESAKDHTEYLPVVTIRDKAVVPLNSKPHENTYAVGDTVRLRYSQQGKIVASFLNEDGKAESAPSAVLTAMGVVVVVIGLLIAKFYRGAVSQQYINKELARLTA